MSRPCGPACNPGCGSLATPQRDGRCGMRSPAVRSGPLPHQVSYCGPACIRCGGNEEALAGQVSTAEVRGCIQKVKCTCTDSRVSIPIQQNQDHSVTLEGYREYFQVSKILAISSFGSFNNCQNFSSPHLQMSPNGTPKATSRAFAAIEINYVLCLRTLFSVCGCRESTLVCGG